MEKDSLPMKEPKDSSCYQFTSPVSSCDKNEKEKGKSIECLCCMLGQLLEDTQYLHED